MAHNQGGAPKGNKNAARAHEARTALIKALEKKSGVDVTVVSRLDALVKIWEIQVDKALEGDNDSAKTIFDRLDGKPKQAVDIQADDAKFTFNLKYN